MQRNSLPETGFLRLRAIVGRPKTKTSPAEPGLLPMCRSTFLTRVRQGKFPKPTKALGARITAWKVEDIRSLLEQLAPAEGGAE